MMRLRALSTCGRHSAMCVAALTLVACGSAPKINPPAAEPSPSHPLAAVPAAAVPALPAAGSGRGGYYLDDGPGEQPPQGLLETPDPEPKVEPYSTRGNRPYVVFGKSYTPITDNRPLKQRGVGSWYGKKFHGQKTSSGELYDMYKMTAAHPTLPIPSYARVTNLRNGVQVIVRVNDRGPFHSGRIIDLSYTAALKLGYLGKGSSELEVERLLPDEIERIAANRQNRPEPVVPPPSSPVVSALAAAPPSSASAPVAPIDSTELSAILAGFSQAEAAPVNTVEPVASVSGPGFYLQLGSYQHAASAEAARAGLTRSRNAGLPPIEVVQSGAVYRLFSGPFSTRAEAAGAAQKVEEGGLPKPLVVQR